MKDKKVISDSIGINVHAYLSNNPKAIVYWFYDNGILVENLQGCQISYVQPLLSEERFVVFEADIGLDYHSYLYKFMKDYWEYLRKMAE